MPPRRSARVSAAASAAPKSRASSISDLSSESDAESAAPPLPPSRKSAKAGSSKPRAKATAKSMPNVSKKPTSLPSSDESESDHELTHPPTTRWKHAAFYEATAEASLELATDLLSDAGSDFEPDSPPQPRRKGHKAKPVLIPASFDAGSDFEPISPPLKRRRTRASPPESEEEAKDFPDTERGGPAAMEVYSTLDILQNILSMVDKATLAGMLRLEKAVTTPVSAVLYRTINVSQITRMSRGSPRRVIYCDAVKVLDINPAPFANAGKSLRRMHHQPASPFHPTLLKDLPVWLKKLPNLQTIIRDRPSSKAGEPFTVHISGRKITVDIETPYKFEISPFPSSGTPTLPTPPKFAGYTIRHTIALTVWGGYTAGAYNYATGTHLPMVPDVNLGVWKNWLFADPTLDPRVSRISLERCMMKLSFDETVSFISQRKANSDPVLSFAMPPMEGINFSQLRLITSTIGPQLRTLYLPSSVINAIRDWQNLILHIGYAFPCLRKLVVSSADEVPGMRATSSPNPSIPVSAKLCGLPDLREFRFPTLHVHEFDQLALARSVSRVGGPDCLFYPSGLTDDKAKEAFNHLVSKLKSSQPRYTLLHTLQSKDLDLTHPTDFEGHSFEPTNGHFRRVAWNTTATYTIDLTKQHDKLDGLVTKQKAAVEAYQATLARTMDGLEEAGGDVQAENKVLRREFEKVLKDQAEMAAACQAMKAAAADMETKSRTMSAYAQTWLSANKEDGKAAKGT